MENMVFKRAELISLRPFYPAKGMDHPGVRLPIQQMQCQNRQCFEKRYNQLSVWLLAMMVQFEKPCFSCENRKAFRRDLHNPTRHAAGRALYPGRFSHCGEPGHRRSGLSIRNAAA
jgi:hypothetical protein